VKRGRLRASSLLAVALVVSEAGAAAADSPSRAAPPRAAAGPARRAAADPSAKALRRAIDPIVLRPELAAAFWGIEVRSLETGRRLYAFNAERAFRPASTLKLVTTAAALDALGSDSRLRTSVESTGRLDALGRVLGDVYLVGRGDPELSADSGSGRPTAAFEEMADQLRAAGVRRIEGRLIGHEGAFSGDARGSDWTWEDLVWSYGAEVSALSFDDNQVELRLAPGERPGDPAVLDLVPVTPLVTVACEVATVPAGVAEDLRLDREPGTNHVHLSGRLPIGGGWSGRIAVRDPARFAALALAAVLEAKGISISGGIGTSRAPLPAGTRVLAAHESATLAELVRATNKESRNLHAEMLLRLVGLEARGEGSAEKGRDAELEILKRLGVDTSGWALSDGSGLARTNLVTPRGMVALLAAMDRHPEAAAFRASLPVAGVDGTLEKRMRGTAAEGRVLAKTGTLNLANALAGYATTRRGARLAFAAFVNNHARRGPEAVAALDALAAALVEAR
jgi:serine-type D-Ala-D-Ala carboxypeptidase/endopeptidase (penicillin-binding protein 4)